LKEVCSILVGLATAADFRTGQELLQHQNFNEIEEWLQDAFEVARRHKIRNPDSLRNCYGKLLHALQDSVSADVRELTDVTCVRPLRTVHSFLQERGLLSLLHLHWA
ncbi:MAG: hypothetical protein MHM6MM_009410, partial [Cercozoa sp. M6MM]